MIVRELISRFGFKVDKKGFQKANEGFSKLKKAAGVLVTALVAGKVASTIRNITNEAAALADQIDKTSKRLGVNAQALQELQFAANLAGASNQDLSASLRILSRNADEAATGSAEYADEFKRLGVNVRTGTGQLKSAEVLLTEMADGLQRLKGDTERVAIAQKLLGRGGAALIPLLTQGTEAIRTQREEARELGLFDEDLIALGVELTDTNRRFAQVMTSVKNILAKALLPGLIRTKKSIIEWMKANREWLAQKIENAFDAIGRAIEFVHRVLKPVYWIIKTLVTGIYDLGKRLYEANPAVFKFATLMAAVAAAILLPISPLILWGVLLALLVEDFTLWWEEGDKANTVMGRLDETLGGALGNIKEMIKQSEAGGPAVLEWSEVWDGAMMSMSESFDEFALSFRQTWFDIRQWFSKTIGEFALEFKQIWFDIEKWFSDIVKDMKAEFAFLVHDIETGVARIPLLGRLIGVQEGGGAPAVAALPARAGGAFAPATTIAVNVQSAPGQDPEQLGGTIARVVDERLEGTFRQAARAHVPATP